MGSLSEQVDREDAKKFVPLSYAANGPAGWALLIVAIGAGLKAVGADIPFLEQTQWSLYGVIGGVLLIIWIITRLRLSAAVGGDENTPID